MNSQISTPANGNARPPVLVAVVSDTHINGTTALCPPKVRRLEGQLVHHSEAQRVLWHAWLEFWQIARRLAQQYGAELWCVFVGDILEGQHHGTTQLVSYNEAVQFKMGLSVMLGIKRIVKKLWVVGGTSPTHAGPSAGYEEQIARIIKAEPDPESRRHVHWHLRMVASGVRFDFRHHRRLSLLPWTHGGPPNRLAAQLLYKYAKAGHLPPHVAVRAHGHKFDESSRQHPIKVVFCPCWQFATSYGVRFEDNVDIGGLLFLCHDGNVQMEPILFYPQDEKDPWKEA